MLTKTLVIRALVAVIIIAALAACQPPPPLPSATDTPEPSASPTDEPTEPPTPIPPTLTATATATHTATATATATATQTQTPTPSATPTAAPLVIDLPAAMPTASSDPAEEVWAFPGPVHYEGDLLDVVFASGDTFVETLSVRVQIDSQPATTETALLNFFFQPTYQLEDVFDTTGQAGSHTIRITGGGINVTYTFEVLPADQRPLAEAQAAWQTREIACCTLHYLSHTAAARDIEKIAAIAQESVDAVETAAESSLDGKFEIVLMDRMWFNGGFGGGGALAITYTDRPYGPLQGDIGLETVLRHEATHALGAISGMSDQFPLGEGIAVYFAGGHYKPEPFIQRGGALYDLGWFSAPFSGGRNHETRYLQEALLIVYLREVYGEEGWDTFRAYRIEGLAEDEFPDLEAWYAGAVRAATGKSTDDFEAEYRAWLDSHDPGNQLEDLYLTVTLQELRREYQRLYAPYPMSLFIEPDLIYADPELIPDVIREPRAPENIALEVLLMHAQEALQAGRYQEVSTMIDLLRAALIDGDLDAGPLDDYQAIAEAAAAAGYEVVDIRIDGDTAAVQAIRTQPQIESITLTRIGDEWVFEE